MKKTILISFLILLCSLFYGQGSSNLGFNQVLNYEYGPISVSGGNETTAGTLTVPSNKVWKITSGSIYHTNNGNHDQAALLVGKLVVFELNSDNNYGVANTVLTPIWLSSGTYSVTIQNRGSGSSFSGGLSIVEFNIE